MKILHLLYESRGDSYGMGGVGERAYQIYHRLKSRHDITILCKKYPGARDGMIDGLRHVFAGAESRSLTRTLLYYAFHAARYARLHARDYDIVIEEFSPATPTFLHRLRGTPVILQVQGYPGRLYFKKYNPLYASTLCLFERIRPPLYRNFIFIDEHTSGRFSLSGETLTRIIPNGVPPELMEGACTDGGYILYLGRIDVFGKGLDLLLEAYQAYRLAPGTAAALDLVIAGDGRDMGRLKRMLADVPPRTRDHVTLTGWVSGRAKTEILRKASFFVLPSRHEVQGISVLEAMAAGKAVITSDIPELSYAAAGQAGICFATGDSGSLAEALALMASDRNRERMGMKGKVWVRDLSWEKVAGRFEDFLVTVAKERAGG